MLVCKIDRKLFQEAFDQLPIDQEVVVHYQSQLFFLMLGDVQPFSVIPLDTDRDHQFVTTRNALRDALTASEKTGTIDIGRGRHGEYYALIDPLKIPLTVDPDAPSIPENSRKQAAPPPPIALPTFAVVDADAVIAGIVAMSIASFGQKHIRSERGATWVQAAPGVLYRITLGGVVERATKVTLFAGVLDADSARPVELYTWTCGELSVTASIALHV